MNLVREVLVYLVVRKFEVYALLLFKWPFEKVHILLFSHYSYMSLYLNS